MATIEQAVYYKIVNDTDIEALIGTRFYTAGDVPQNVTLPYMTYQRISGVRHRHQAGAGLVEARYQFNCYATKQIGAAALGTALRAALERYRGDMGEAGSTIAVRGAFVQDDSDQGSPPTEGSQRGPIWQTVDVIFWYVE